MSRDIPAEVLSQHLAILGKTGSGKTSTEKLAIEQVVAGGARVCVLDTIKSDWWGITSSASGKREGLPFKILGGPRGHVPLHSNAGKVIGQLVGSGKLPLSIIDMADFEAGGIQHFFVDFAQSLMRNMRGVVYLVIEEAHEIAPKERAGFGAESMAIHWAKKLATAGRSKGIRLIVATQRVQALHNAVLGSCETVIAHRLTTPADQKPVLDWLKANAKPGVIEMVAAQLSSLPTGTAWVCSGEAKIFEHIAFKKFATFDNTATPTGDGEEIQVKTAPVDQDELRSIIGDAVKQAEADDPKALRAQIARLEQKVAEKLQWTPDEIAALQNDKAAAEARGYKIGFEEALSKAGEESHVRRMEMLAGIRVILNNTLIEFDRASELWRQQHLSIQPFPPHKTTITKEPITVTPAKQIVGHHVPIVDVRRFEKADPGSVGSTLKPALQRCIDAVAWWRSIGKDPIERARAAVVAGLSPKASTFGVYIAELARIGLVESNDGTVRLTDAGWKCRSRDLPAGNAAELKRVGLSLLGPQEQKIFETIYQEYPKAIGRKRVAEICGLSPTASTAGVYIANVAAYGLIERAGGGQVIAADWLFP